MKLNVLTTIRHETYRWLQETLCLLNVLLIVMNVDKTKGILGPRTIVLRLLESLERLIQP